MDSVQYSHLDGDDDDDNDDKRWTLYLLFCVQHNAQRKVTPFEAVFRSLPLQCNST